MPRLIVILMYLTASGIVVLPAALAYAGQAAVVAEVDQEPHPATPDSYKEAVTHERDMVREVVKQTYEQPLHFLMSAGPIWLSRYLTAVPWYGWSIIPVLAYREWRQWPSDRWWDPLLDATFLILGVIGATWRGGTPRVAARPRGLWRRRAPEATSVPRVPRRA